MPTNIPSEDEAAEDSSSDLAAIVTPRFMVVGTSPEAGAATVALGLLVAYKQAGVGVCSAVIGKSMITATQHRRVSGRFSHLLDPWLLSRDQLVDSFARLSVGGEVALITGERGMFDERPQDDVVAHEAEMAALLGAPVILVFDARGFGDSVRAMIYGFSTFYRDATLAGVIANHIQDEAHEAVIRASVESLGGPIYLGGIPEGATRTVEERQSEHYFLNPSLMSRNRIIEAGGLIKAHIALESVSRIAETARPLYVPKEVIGSYSKSCRIAVADDAAFQLTIQDNFDILRRAGAELVAFSPLADAKLPPRIGGIYFPSGYVDLYVDTLSANELLAANLLNFVERGGAVYAEGSALAYLCRSVVLSTGEDRPMVGILPGHATFTEAPERVPKLRYCTVRSTEDTVVSTGGMEFRGMREPRLALRLEGDVHRCFEVTDRRAHPDEEAMLIAEGLRPQAPILGTMVHAHWGSNPTMGNLFANSAREAFARLTAGG